MHINLTKDWESKLEDQLISLDQMIDINQIIRPEEDWGETNKPPYGIINGSWAYKTIYLTQESFKHGTIRVLVPCKLVLCESIAFNPNHGLKSDGSLTPHVERNNDWFPHADQTAYFTPTQSQRHGDSPSHAFRLGFFAMITIEHSQGTVIDLNGFTLGSHPLFALQQRFHAVIELANQPFVPNQGPAMFGQNLRAAGKVWIKNGTIGRSSHHGIHGNGMKDILISDVTFVDYEVAAISLNGGKRILIQDCQVKGTFKNIPILGSYSTARFLKLISGQYISNIERLAITDQSIVQGLSNLKSKLNILNDQMDKTVEAVRTNQLNQIPAIFQNQADENNERLADANPYGIAIHSRGVLVNAFLCTGSKFTGLNDLSKIYETTDVTIRRTNISNTRGNVREVLALGAIKPGNDHPDPIADSAGSIFRFFPLDPEGKRGLPSGGDLQTAEMNSAGNPSLTVVGEVQIALAKLEMALHDFDQLPANQNNSHYRNLNLGLTGKLWDIVKWAENHEGPIVKERNNIFRYRNTPSKKFKLYSNGDSMFHVNKGAIGLFLQAIDGLNLDRVTVTVVENKGLPGSVKAGNYRDGSDGGHKGQNQQIGYSGADSRGIYLGACSNVSADRIQSHGIVSYYGSASGIEVGGGCEHINMISPVVGIVRAGEKYAKEYDPTANSRLKPFTSRFPNIPPIANGLLADATTRNIKIEDYQNIGKIESAVDEFPAKIKIHSRLNYLNPNS